MSDQSDSAPLLIKPQWPVPNQVKAVFTSRIGGVSSGAFAALNLATHVGDNPANVARNRSRLQQAAALPGAPAWLKQVHGNRVVRLEATSRRLADAAITAVPGKVCVVMVADCVPILLSAADGSEVAAVHAGWRGLDNRVISSTVDQFRASGSAIHAWIGPHISAAAYVVSADLKRRFCDLDAGYASCFQHTSRGITMDLGEIARRQLKCCGIRHISSSEHCVHTHSDLYFSYRRDGESGRMAALIWLEQ